MNIENTVALVTGANRGIGAALVEALLERGASKVYAAARREGDLGTIPSKTIFPDPMAKALYAQWTTDHKAIEHQFAAM